jgi:dihydroorotate dehydrogenase electron transfer subunit
MRQFDARITTNEDISPSWKILGFEWPSELAVPRPGQFFTFRPSLLSSGDSGLLRRPLAFAAFESGRAYALYQIRGSGTTALAALAPGLPIDILGPLGTAFRLPEPGESAVLVGGGIGIGPILYLHDRILDSGKALEGNPPADLRLFLGFRTAAQIPRIPLSSLAGALGSAILATDDGSAGFAGRVTDAVRKNMGQAGTDQTAVDRRCYYACGPAPMLSAVALMAAQTACPAEVSVEQWMACGVGACYGCVVPAAAGGYLRACADGPVFDALALDWEALA